MKKQYRMQNLECANCAAKMEAAIRRIDGVEDAAVSFLTQRLTIEAPEDRLDEIMQQVIKACKKFEPDCTVIL